MNDLELARIVELEKKVSCLKKSFLTGSVTNNSYNNGLNLTGDVVGLGGNLEEDTVIVGENNDLSITQLDNLNLQADAINLDGKVNFSDVMKLTPSVVPVTPIQGDIYLDNVSGLLRFYNGSDWYTFKLSLAPSGVDPINASVSGNIKEQNLSSDNIRDADGAIVTLYDNTNNLIAFTTTSSDGGFSLGSIAEGVYRMTIKNTDNLQNIPNLIINRSEIIVNQNITLISNSPF